MSATGGYGAAAPRRRLVIRAETLREGLVALAVVSGFFVMYEPAPYDLLFIVAIGLFAATGLTLPRMLLPFLLLVILYQLGAVLTLTLVLDRANTMKWTVVGVFLAGTGVFYALFLAERTGIRARLIANAWVIAGACGGALAIVGYFHLAPGSDKLLIFGRAKATFKDPNVFAPYLIFPALILIQRLYATDHLKRAAFMLVPLGLIMSGIFLSFSRGSWGHLIASAALMTGLTILASPTPARRARILLICGAAALGAALLIAVLLSMPSVSSLFAERASLEQNYDVGRYGRFARHIAGAQLAFDKPFGIGIYQFAKIFGADVHNTYLNAFMSYGWLGGLALPTLVILTFVYCVRYVLAPAPWRPIFICAFSTWAVLMMEAWVIDVDHWRHQWALLGMCWGFIVATAKHVQTNDAGAPAPVRRLVG
ncbi:O-antigen ligase family protein [Methylopila turkensis]|uniref:O-antigen ligase domain-containing protein n=1 Tax=Methylopila turkensis TaxID=1437816 RepID=A0A9W6N837_9HYPH|nr:hypothetical protein [Methylopila turkensis]GLK81042.1 hypothetical protein GCM10008174_27830 [Methylopila turkensis]